MILLALLAECWAPPVQVGMAAELYVARAVSKRTGGSYRLIASSRSLSPNDPNLQCGDPCGSGQGHGPQAYVAVAGGGRRGGEGEACGRHVGWFSSKELRSSRGVAVSSLHGCGEGGEETTAMASIFIADLLSCCRFQQTAAYAA